MTGNVLLNGKKKSLGGYGVVVSKITHFQLKLVETYDCLTEIYFEQSLEFIFRLKNVNLYKRIVCYSNKSFYNTLA